MDNEFLLKEGEKTAKQIAKFLNLYTKNMEPNGQIIHNIVKEFFGDKITDIDNEFFRTFTIDNYIGIVYKDKIIKIIKEFLKNNFEIAEDGHKIYYFENTKHKNHIYEFKNLIKKEIKEDTKFESYEQLINMPYEEYLKTKHWKNKSKKCKIYAGFKCQKCGSKDNLAAHHLTYIRLGKEYYKDLICLCGECHKKIHNLK
jgi:hypothetical protein